MRGTARGMRKRCAVRNGSGSRSRQVSSVEKKPRPPDVDCLVDRERGLIGFPWAVAGATEVATQGRPRPRLPFLEDVFVLGVAQDEGAAVLAGAGNEFVA